MRDKYDKAIEFLTKNPRMIEEAWKFPNLKKGGKLFMACSKDGEGHGEVFEGCGCLTQVRHEGFEAETPELTQAIRNDDRIPDRDSITIEDLPVFAEWQRRIDKELGRQ